MSDEDLLINVEEEQPQEETILPKFTVGAVAFPAEDDNMDFRFQANVPEKPDVMDWLTFLFLARHKIDSLYTSCLEQAVDAYLELREGVGAEVAKMDIESFIANRVTQGYEDENSLGLRNVDDSEE